MRFERIEIDSRDPAGADLAAAAWLRGAAVDEERAQAPLSEPPKAAWIGSRSVLETLGLDRDTQVSLDRLASAREGRIAMLAWEWSPPQSVSRLWLGEGPEQRAAIDQALLASADASLDELRRTTPLVEPHERASGVAAVAIVQRTTGQSLDEGPESPQLRVRTLIVAVEDADGRIVTPHPPSEIDQDLGSDANAAGQWTLAWELTKLGYTVDRGERADELFEVAGPQPYERNRRILPSVGDRFRLAHDVDRYPHFVATEGTPGTVTNVTDGTVSLRLDFPLPGAEQWDNEVVWDTTADANFWADVEPVRDGESPLRAADVEAVQERLLRAWEDAMVREGRVGPERLALSVPDAFDEVGAIGERRRQLYSSRMRPLAEWLEVVPDHWVEARHVALGPPSEHVDLGAARLTRLIESRIEVVERELREARETGTSFDVRGLERKLAGVRHQAQQLREEGLHVDQDIDSDEFVRSAAYAREHTIRRENARQTERDPEWLELDADALQSAVEERLLPDQEYEQYQGPLGWTAWLAERRRAEELQRFGIARPELPAPYEAALGPERAERLARLVEDARLELAYSPRSHEELSTQAQQLEAAGQALDLGLSERIAALEQQADEDRESVRDVHEREIGLENAAELAEGPERDLLRDDAEAERAHAQHLRDGLRALRSELAALSERDDHPDRWLARNGRQFADALAARLQLERERPLPDTPDVGVDFG